jgi:hypothetical protein
MKKNPLLHKQAGIGGDPERSFEQSFASLAYAYIQDKAPGLLDYMVGFQLIDRNDDNTKAIGIFGFKVGDEWVYAPIFFLNGDMKGHELLYLKSKDSFVPMKENWVNYIVSKRPQILGGGESESLEDLGVLSPDLRSLSDVPTSGNKTAEFVPPQLRDWAKSAMPYVAQWATKSPFSYEKFAELDEKLDFGNFLKQDVRLVKLAIDMCKTYPTLKTALDSYHGKNLFRDSLLDLKANVEKAAASAVLRNSKIAPKKTILGKSAVDSVVSVEIITSSIVSENLPELSSEEKKKLLNDGYVIKDRRTDDDISIAYNTEISQSLRNPDATGVYDILVKPGDFERCVVLNNPVHGRNRESMATIVCTETGRWLNTHTSNLWARDLSDEATEQSSYSDWYDGLSDNKSLDGSGNYILVSPSGSSSAPFEVGEKLTDNSYKVYWNSYPRTSRPSYMPSIASDDSHIDFGEDSILEFNSREGTSFKNVGGTVYAPEQCKVVKLSRPSYGQDNGSEDKPLRLGNLADIQLQIFQKTASLKLYSDHHEIVVNNERMTSKQALFHLVRTHGFREKIAKKMVKEASRFGGARYRVKYAQPFPAMMGPGAPAFPAPDMAAGGVYGGVPEQSQQVDFMNVPSMSAAGTDPSIYDPMVMPDQNAMQVAQQAAQQGQQEVFDTALISSMLKAVREDSLIDRYLGDLMKALDRLGRILFMFYWHNEEFMDRYGKQDMPELEDTLRNSFEMLGDLVLFLKQKTIDPMLGDSNPDIEEAARN